MADRREPQVREILRRIENALAPHVLAALNERITAELAATPDTADLLIELPLGEGARATVKGFPPTLGQRLREKLSS